MGVSTKANWMEWGFWHALIRWRREYLLESWRGFEGYGGGLGLGLGYMVGDGDQGGAVGENDTRDNL